MTGVEHIELETPFGRLRGTKSEGVTSFRGVPYAEAPVGPKRFEMPTPIQPWKGVRDATLAAPVPPQNPSRLDAVMGAYAADQSEDCLHLDIWTSPEAGVRAPVLVFIHGGAFMTGGGSLPCYDGRILARENGLVVVNITYRLGILGFLPYAGFGGLNLGLHDQVAALRWVSQAIDAFGGDPERVTVIGQSAGGFSIAALSAATEGSRLFKRGVLMSAPVGIKLHTPDESKPIIAGILDVLGLGLNDIDKLRTMPTDKMLEGLRALAKRPPAIQGDITPPFMPVLDDALVPHDPSKSIQMGNAAWCDMMIGVTREEHAAFLASNPSLDKLSDDELEILFRRKVGDDAKSTIAGIRATRVPATPRTILGDFHSDEMFAKPSVAIAGTQSKLGRRAYTYFFDWQSPNPELGACHCIDLPFLFGNFDVWQAAPMVRGADWREVDDLSRLFRGSVAAFAEAGDPNGRGLPHWPAYGTDQNILHFDRRITVSRHLA